MGLGYTPVTDQLVPVQRSSFRRTVEGDWRNFLTVFGNLLHK